MTPIQHDHATSVFQKLRAVNGVQSSGVCRTSEVDGRGNAHLNHAVRIAVGMVAEQLGWRVVRCFTDVTRKVITIRALIFARLDFLVQIVGGAQGMNINGIF